MISTVVIAQLRRIIVAHRLGGDAHAIQVILPQTRPPFRCGDRGRIDPQLPFHAGDHFLALIPQAVQDGNHTALNRLQRRAVPIADSRCRARLPSADRSPTRLAADLGRSSPSSRSACRSAIQPPLGKIALAGEDFHARVLRQNIRRHPLAVDMLGRLRMDPSLATGRGVHYAQAFRLAAGFNAVEDFQAGIRRLDVGNVTRIGVAHSRSPEPLARSSSTAVPSTSSSRPS